MNKQKLKRKIIKTLIFIGLKTIELIGICIFLVLVGLLGILCKKYIILGIIIMTTCLITLAIPWIIDNIEKTDELYNKYFKK